MDKKTQTDLEAAAFRRLVDHFRERSDVQNIDMVNLAGFCRNCLSKWYMEQQKKKALNWTMKVHVKSSTACLMKSGKINIKAKPLPNKFQHLENHKKTKTHASQPGPNRSSVSIK